MDRSLPSLAITLAHNLERDGTPVHGEGGGGREGGYRKKCLAK